MARLAWSVTLLLCALLTGCGNDATPTPLPALPPTLEAAVPQATDETVVNTASDQLVVWLPAFTGFAAEGSAGTLLTNAFHQFEQRNPAVPDDLAVLGPEADASLVAEASAAARIAVGAV